MFCGPKTDEQPFSGIWDHSYECECTRRSIEAIVKFDSQAKVSSAFRSSMFSLKSHLFFFFTLLTQGNKGWANPPETCDVYEGQKAGRYDQSKPYANAAGRTDVEGW